jgi:hypothetical protein
MQSTSLFLSVFIRAHPWLKLVRHLTLALPVETEKVCVSAVHPIRTFEQSRNRWSKAVGEARIGKIILRDVFPA